MSRIAVRPELVEGPFDGLRTGIRQAQPERLSVRCQHLAIAQRFVAHSGFTLLELLLVVAIIAVASAGVSFALRDSAQSQLEREAVRLAALLESARSRSLASGVAVRWRATDTGFAFDGLPAGTLPQAWLSNDVTSAAPARLLLGPEPIIAAQSVQLVSRSQPDRSLTVATDGLRPFGVKAAAAGAAPGAITRAP